MKNFFGFLMLIFTVVAICQKMCKETTQITGSEVAVIGSAITSAVLKNYVGLQKMASVLGIATKVVEWRYYEDKRQGGAVVEMDDGTEEYIDVTQYRNKHPKIDSKEKFQSQQKKLQKDFDECTLRVLENGASGAQKREQRASCLEDKGYDENDLLLYKYHGWYREELS